MKKLKVIIILILLLLAVFCVTTIASYNKSDNKKSNNKEKIKVEQSSNKEEKIKKKESTKNKENYKKKEVTQDKEIVKKKDNSNTNESSEYVTKEYDFNDMNFHFLMDVPKSWEGQYIVQEHSYYYDDGADTIASGTVIYDRRLSYSVSVIYVDKVTGFKFELFTIEKVDGRDRCCYIMDNMIVKEISGEKYAMGGRTDIFDEPREVFERYTKVKRDFVKVMDSIRGK